MKSLTSFFKKFALLPFIVLVVLLNVSNSFAQEETASNVFPYHDFPIELIEDDQNIQKDRIIFTPTTVEVLWEYMKGFLVLPREYLIIQGREPSTDPYTVANAYTGPAFSYTTDGIYKATKSVDGDEINSDNNIRHDSDLEYDAMRDWMCARQDCSSSTDGCIDPNWRFNTPTFCKRRLPMCAPIKSYDNNYKATGEIDLSLYMHPLNGRGYVTSNFGTARRVVMDGQTAYVSAWGTEGDWLAKIKSTDNNGNDVWTPIGGVESPKIFKEGDWDSVSYVHEGIDLGIRGETDLSIHATMDGVVEYAGPQVAYGNYVVIRHDYDGIYSIYAHMVDGSITVKRGQSVKRGEILGQVGNTGNSTGPHLHFELRRIADEWQTPWNTNSWNGSSPCLTDFAKVLDRPISTNCPSNIDPTPIITGVNSTVDIQVDSPSVSMGNTISNNCVDDPYCASAGNVFFTDEYIAAVASNLKYPLLNDVFNLHVNMFKGVAPDLENALNKFSSDPETKRILRDSCGSNCKIGIAHGFRTVEEQRIIRDSHCGTAFDCTGAAAPGYSQHHTGLAVDMYFLLNGEWDNFSNFKNLNDAMVKQLEKHGIIRPVAEDPPHFFYTGGREYKHNEGWVDGDKVSVQQDGVLMGGKPEWGSKLPPCDPEEFCEDNPGQLTASFIDAIANIAGVTDVPPELLYAIMMQETAGLCVETSFFLGDTITECTGNPLEIVWSEPTPGVDTKGLDIRGITQVSHQELKRSITVFGPILKQCVEAATGLDVSEHKANSSNPSKFKDPHSPDPLYTRHVAAHALCMTAISMREYAAEWDVWRTNVNGTVDAYAHARGSLAPLDLETWYKNISNQTEAMVDVNWPTYTPAKYPFTLIEHIGRRYHGSCILPASVSGFNRDIYYCKDIENFYNEALSNGLFRNSGSMSNLARFTGTIDCTDPTQNPSMPTIKLDKNLVNVMVIGDSQVEFETTKLLMNLNEQFIDHGINAEFIGMKSTDDVNHEGYKGATVRSILQGGDGAVSTPVNLKQFQSLVFIQLGTNEVVNFDISIDQYIKDMNELVHKINQSNGETAIVIGSIPPFRGNENTNKKIDEYNSALEKLSTELGPNVRFARTSLSGLDGSEDLSDKVHLSPTGSKKTAINWVITAMPFFEGGGEVQMKENTIKIQIIGDRTISDSRFLEYFSSLHKDEKVDVNYYGSKSYNFFSNLKYDSIGIGDSEYLFDDVNIASESDYYYLQFDTSFINDNDDIELIVRLAINRILAENPDGIILIGSFPTTDTGIAFNEVIGDISGDYFSTVLFLDNNLDNSTVYIQSSNSADQIAQEEYAKLVGEEVVYGKIKDFGVKQIAHTLFSYLSTLHGQNN
jgi:murein DD-endopeptidase MepM/ murein hydrolase activator NlpD